MKLANPFSVGALQATKLGEGCLRLRLLQVPTCVSDMSGWIEGDGMFITQVSADMSQERTRGFSATCGSELDGSISASALRRRL
jgi:hypothetical protein